MSSRPLRRLARADDSDRVVLRGSTGKSLLRDSACLDKFRAWSGKVCETRRDYLRVEEQLAAFEHEEDSYADDHDVRHNVRRQKKAYHRANRRVLQAYHAALIDFATRSAELLAAEAAPTRQQAKERARAAEDKFENRLVYSGEVERPAACSCPAARANSAASTDSDHDDEASD